MDTKDVDEVLAIVVDERVEIDVVEEVVEAGRIVEVVWTVDGLVVGAVVELVEARVLEEVVEVVDEVVLTVDGLVEVVVVVLVEARVLEVVVEVVEVVEVVNESGMPSLLSSGSQGSPIPSLSASA